ncbi:hypothetical protein OESDEN_04199 [Oesophagostomum dentatum]|uniref:CC domain-containing protein n=1 Tax=Oesophagostomum dentatum TaxID=61180 RepID=A0A0B1TEZ6_OESDE|nr:hypothetical protein OESDEN_04199 [Oesophagostomum dentatum]
MTFLAVTFIVVVSFITSANTRRHWNRSPPPPSPYGYPSYQYYQQPYIVPYQQSYWPDWQYYGNPYLTTGQTQQCIGQCVNGICPSGYTCIGNQCCSSA